MATYRNQPSVPPGRSAASAWRSKVVADQAVALVLGIALLGGSALLRHALEKRRTTKDEDGVQLVREDPESEKTLSSLAVTFPLSQLPSSAVFVSM